jgi:hypothetical protein
MRDSAAVSRLSTGSLEHQNVSSPRRLSLDKVPRSIDGAHPENAAIEGKCARRILDCQCQVRQTVSGNWSCRTSHVRPANAIWAVSLCAFPRQKATVPQSYNVRLARWSQEEMLIAKRHPVDRRWMFMAPPSRIMCGRDVFDYTLRPRHLYRAEPGPARTAPRIWYGNRSAELATRAPTVRHVRVGIGARTSAWPAAPGWRERRRRPSADAARGPYAAWGTAGAARGAVLSAGQADSKEC